jgi:hypothetical protein
VEEEDVVGVAVEVVGVAVVGVAVEVVAAVVEEENNTCPESSRELDGCCFAAPSVTVHIMKSISTQ